MGTAASLQNGMPPGLVEGLESAKRLRGAAAEDQRGWLREALGSLSDIELREQASGSGTCKDLNPVVLHQLRAAAQATSARETCTAAGVVVFSPGRVLAAGGGGVSASFRDYEPATAESLWPVGMHVQTMMAVLFGMTCMDEHGVTAQTKLNSMLTVFRYKPYSKMTVGSILANERGYPPLLPESLIDPMHRDEETRLSRLALGMRALMRPSCEPSHVGKPSECTTSVLAVFMDHHGVSAGARFIDLLRERVLKPIGVTIVSDSPGPAGPYGHAGSCDCPVHPQLHKNGGTAPLRQVYMTLGGLAKWTLALQKMASGEMVLPIKPETFKAVMAPFADVGSLSLSSTVHGWGCTSETIADAATPCGFAVCVNNDDGRDLEAIVGLVRPLARVLAAQSAGVDPDADSVREVCERLGTDLAGRPEHSLSVPVLTVQRTIHPIARHIFNELNAKVKWASRPEMDNLCFGLAGVDGVEAIGIAGHAPGDKMSPITQSTAFDVSGLVRGIVAVAYTVLCCEYGDLALDTPLRDALPHLADAIGRNPAWGDVTVGQLLECTGGAPTEIPASGAGGDDFEAQRKVIHACFTSKAPANVGTVQVGDFGHLIVAHAVTAYMRRKSGNQGLGFLDIVETYVMAPAGVSWKKPSAPGPTGVKPSPFGHIHMTVEQAAGWVAAWSRLGQVGGPFGVRPWMAARLALLPWSVGDADTDDSICVKPVPHSRLLMVGLASSNVSGATWTTTSSFLSNVYVNGWAIPLLPGSLPSQSVASGALHRKGVDISHHLELYLAEYNATRPLEKKIPACAVAGADLNGITAFGVTGVGSLKEDSFGIYQVQKDRGWHLGSCGKSMTVLLFTKICLVPGLMTLDTRIEDALPHLAENVRRSPYKDITVRHCLIHHAGFRHNLPNEGEGGIKIVGLNELQQRRLAIQEALRLEPQCPPGTHRQYSNSGYFILGHIIETVVQRETGNPEATFFDILQEQLLKPLGLKAELGPPSGGSYGHMFSSTDPCAANQDNSDFFTPAGRMSMTVQDHALWVAVNLNYSHGRAVEGLGIPGSVGKMMLDLYPITHGGSNGYWQSYVSAHPSIRSALVAESNQDFDGEFRIRLIELAMKLQTHGVLI